jgi:hypothetical protein
VTLNRAQQTAIDIGVIALAYALSLLFMWFIARTPQQNPAPYAAIMVMASLIIRTHLRAVNRARHDAVT